MKKVLSVILALVMMSLPFMIPTVSADTESDYKQKLNELSSKEQEYQQKLNEANSSIKNKEAYSETLTNQISTLSQEITTYNNQISSLNTSISKKQAIVDKANKDIKAQMNTLKKRIRTIYMAGETSDLEIILGAKDFSDFLDKVELVKTLSDYDKNLINKIQKRLNKVSSEKKALETQKSEVETAEAQLSSKKSKLNTLLSNNKSVLAGLYEKKSSTESLIADAQKMESQVKGELQAYYAELKRKKAEEEAAKATESTTESTDNSNNNNNNNNSTDSGSTDESSTDSGNTDSGNAVAPSGSGYTWPTPGYYGIASPYGEDRGYSHSGLDIAAPMGATVVAAESGTVVSSNNSCTHNFGKSGSCGCGGGYGNYVTIAHSGGRSTTYAHLTSASVSAGQSVSKGQVIGSVGSTGWSTGAHLHFETRSYGSTYDPMSEY